MRRYLVVVEGGQDGENFSAYSPDVDGCVATGDTLSEVIQNMYDALQFHLEGMAIDGQVIPESSAPPYTWQSRNRLFKWLGLVLT